ncbi:hypothetical protein RJT34_26909 [Clitoria ternatea]|uniref:Uncharacterized protein n=1 Tax=Clitoria ternatea TaxID=43366 RepID=A0AAN9F9C5_CLITE
MTPRADEFGGENLSTTDEEDDDEALKRDLAALSKACTNSPRNSNGVTAVVDSDRSNDDGNDGNSDDDDVDYLLKLDPLLAAGDSIVPAVNHSGNGIDDSDEEKDAESIRKVNDLFHKLESVPPPPPPPASLSDDDDDDVDDVGTARAILSHYSNKVESVCLEVIIIGFSFESQDCGKGYLGWIKVQSYHILMGELSRLRRKSYYLDPYIRQV